MTTSGGEINNISIYPNKKRINVIIRDINGNNEYVDTIVYDGNEEKYKSLDDICYYITKKFRSDICPYCCYDFKTRCNILYAKAKEKNDFIDWKIDFYSLPIKTVFHYRCNKPITIIVINSESRIGCTGGLSLFDTVTMLSFIIEKMKRLYVLIKISKNPFSELDKEYHIGEDIIKATILLGNKWKFGFISSEKIQNKKLIEKSIMKKLGYKKYRNYWIKTKEENFIIEKLFY